MTERTENREVRAALYEFQRYLSDRVAPLMVVDPIETLLRQPPELIASEIHAWTTSQYRGAGAEVPVSDYLFHAVRKLYHFHELELIPKKTILEFLDRLRPKILEICPPEDREFLDRNLGTLGESSASGEAAHVEVLYRQPGSESNLASDSRAQARPVAADGMAKASHRLSLILDRLQRVPLGGGSGGGVPAGGSSPMPAQRSMLVSNAVTALSSTVHDRSELDEGLGRLRAAGVEVDPDALFHHLSRSLPDWAVPAVDLPEGDEFPEDDDLNPVDAMRRLVSIEDDPNETSRRFRQFLQAAVEQFNEGSLGRAVTMFDLADQLRSSDVIPQSEAQQAVDHARNTLDANQLRSTVEVRESHFLLRRMLHFFPKYRPAGLLQELRTESRRDRRRLLLSLLEVYGTEARSLAMEQLREQGAKPAGEYEKYFVRNLLYVLNRVPAAEAAADGDIDAIASFTALRYPSFVVRESLGALGAAKNPRAEGVLTQRLRDYDALLRKGIETPYSAADLKLLTDRAVVALVRLATESSLHAVVDHCLASDGERDSVARIATLGTIDLTSQPGVLARLIDALREALPRRVLGIMMQKGGDGTAERLVESLAGTPAPEVHEVLEEIVQRYPDREVGKKAETVLAAFGVRPISGAEGPTAPSLAGDIELFGLPNLLQSLAASNLTGILTLTARDGSRIGSLVFEGGKISRCHVGDLRGKTAIFQLFEQPVPGTFSFTEKSGFRKDGSEPEPLDVQSVVFEALRRFDELRLAKTIAPPEASLEATGLKPTPHEFEKDAAIVREVWVRASSGEPPAEWESAIPVDSYRIWRLLAHWVESGSLQPRSQAD